MSSAYRFSSRISTLKTKRGDFRFNQRFDLMRKEYVEGQIGFNPKWNYSWGVGALLRDQRILYLYPVRPEAFQTSLALGDNGLRMARFFSGEIAGNPQPTYLLDPHTPMGTVTYRLRLRPGEARRLTFRMPIVPIPENSVEAHQLRNTDASAVLDQILTLWKGMAAEFRRFHFPEEKVEHFILANTIFDLLAIDKQGDDYIPNVNKFQYHSYYPGNCADMVLALDLVGLHGIAAKLLLYAYKAQFPDGSLHVPSQPQRAAYAEWGMVLWAWNWHFRLTNDHAFLQQIYPGVSRAMQWELQLTRKDALGLTPPATVADDAQLANARQTGMSIWMLIGLQNAVEMAKAMNRNDEANGFEAERHRYREAFEKALAAQTAKSGGWIPPALEGTLAGNHWDELMTLYPEPLFEPFDPRVTATIRKSRESYREGILGYSYARAVKKQESGYVFDSTPLLHYWQTPNNTENALVRGAPDDQKWAVRDLYALLLHTTSTQSPQEFGTVPWSTRDYHEGDILPDGATSAKTIELLRNMVIREYKDDLFLFSALPLAWLEPGRTLSAVDAPTFFGPISVTSQASASKWTITLANKFWTRPNRLIIRVPWFYEMKDVEADGRKVKPTGRELVIASGVRGSENTGPDQTGHARDEL